MNDGIISINTIHFDPSYFITSSFTYKLQKNVCIAILIDPRGSGAGGGGLGVGGWGGGWGGGGGVGVLGGEGGRINQ